MREIDASALALAATILEVTSDLHASRLEQHIVGKASLVIDTWTTMRLNEAVTQMIANTIDGVGMQEILEPLLDVFGDATEEIWSQLGQDFRTRLHEIETQALELIIATGRTGDSQL